MCSHVSFTLTSNRYVRTSAAAVQIEFIVNALAVATGQLLRSLPLFSSFSASTTTARAESYSRFSVRPIHLFDQNFDHDYFCELPLARERDAQPSARRFSSRHVRIRAVRRANRTLASFFRALVGVPVGALISNRTDCCDWNQRVA